MTDKTISQLTAASTPLAGTEVLPIVQSSTTVKATIANIQATPVAAGTASAVQYLNASKVPTTSSTLTYDGTSLGVGASTGFYGGRLAVGGHIAIATGNTLKLWNTGGTGLATLGGTGTNELSIVASDGVKLTNGNLVIGTSGKGIDFSANTNAAGMTSELLANYEEGTFTPVVADADTGGNTATGTFTGRYTRIGRMVNVMIDLTNIDTTGMTSTAAVRVRGLPYTAASSFNQFACSVAAGNVSTGSNPIQGSVLGAYAGLYLYTTVNGANQVSIKVSNLSSGSALVIINAFYLV